MIRDSNSAWGLVSRLFHWSGAIMIIGLFFHGEWMTELPRASRLFHYSWHGHVGYALLFMLLLRLAWRAANPKPAMPAGTPHAQAVIARVSHATLYLLAVVACLTGWALAETFGDRLTPTLFGVIPLPRLLANPSREWHDRLEQWHSISSHALVFFALGHAAAALWHHFVKRNDLLTRMIRARS